MIEEQKCVNCRWWSMEADRICMNEQSDLLGQYRDRSDECDKWEFAGGAYVERDDAH